MSSSSLGIYIDDGIIKYAKLSQNEDKIKVDAYSVVFYENFKNEIDRIIAETSSIKTPVIIGLSNKIISNPQEIKRIENAFKGRKIESIKLVSDSIGNLIEDDQYDEVAIVDLEKQTTITILSRGKVVAFEAFDIGMEEIIAKIIKSENSERKAYDVCKNTTIYTNETNEFYSEGNEYISDIMPTLHKITYEIKKYIDSLSINIEKIYITGMGSTINNIDLYFQEYLANEVCEILKPPFIENNNFLLKDYIEVNSAISLALDGIDYVKPNKQIEEQPKKKKEKRRFSAFEKMLVRVNIVLILMIGVYIAFSTIIENKIDGMRKQVDNNISTIDSEIDKANSDIEKIKKQAEKYDELTKELSTNSNSQNETKISKGAISNMLKAVANVVPKEVKIISIKNTKDNHIVIEVAASDYAQVGALSSAISEQAIMQNVKASNGETVENAGKTIDANSGWIYVTIEGELQ